MDESPTIETACADLPAGPRSFLAYCMERDTLLRATKTALVVGTILALINHGQAVFSGHFTFDWIIPSLVTYLVPFLVAMYSRVQSKRQSDRTQR